MFSKLKSIFSKNQSKSIENNKQENSLNFISLNLNMFDPYELTFLFSNKMIHKSKNDTHELLLMVQNTQTFVPYFLEEENEKLYSQKSKKYDIILSDLVSYMESYSECEFVFNAYMQIDLSENQYEFLELKFVGINFKNKLVLKLVNIRMLDFYEYAECKLNAKNKHNQEYVSGVFRITTKIK
jgi:hypothetical protein